MRTRAELERDIQDATNRGRFDSVYDPALLALELLLDLRDQNAVLIAQQFELNKILAAQVENERDAILKSAGIQS